MHLEKIYRQYERRHEKKNGYINPKSIQHLILLIGNSPEGIVDMAILGLMHLPGQTCTDGFFLQISSRNCSDIIRFFLSFSVFIYKTQRSTISLSESKKRLKGNTLLQKLHMCLGEGG